MKLDPDLIYYMTKEQFRVLIAVEMGMKNHEYVPVPLIESLAALKRSNTYKVIQLLLKHKLIMHYNKAYDGYALTYMGYDYLALKAFMKRGSIKRVGIKIGVGKESDIYLCEGGNPDIEGAEEEKDADLEEQAAEKDGVIFRNPVVVKFARLGRTSFRTVKNNRDYLKGRVAQSWLYLSRIASLKEFAFMKALYNKGFPTPVPIDSNRHGIVMSYIDAYPMAQIREMQNPRKVYSELLDIVIRLAEFGLVHGDFNEFNLMVDDEEKITMIDFPQMTSTNHPNAQYFFGRDVKCLQDFFMRRFGLKFEGIPILETDIEKKEDLDKQIRASGFVKEQIGETDLKAFDTIHEHFLNKDQEEEIKSDDEGEEEEDDQEESKQQLEDQVPKLIETIQIQKQQTEEESKQKVKFQSDEDNEDDSEDDEEKEEDNNREKRKDKKKALELKQQKDKVSASKLVINEEYVKEKAKKQFKTNFNKDKLKRNKNKDKKVMKANENIKEYFMD